MLSRGDRDLRFAFQTHPGSQASCRREAKDSALLSSRDAATNTHRGKLHTEILVELGPPATARG